MAKTWENFECTFFTANNTNGFGDSKYLVLKNKMTRTAFVNLLRSPTEVLSENPSIAYLDPNSELYRRIMEETDDSNITVADVPDDESILINVSGFIGVCCRIPRNTFNTFDFSNNDGVLTDIHVGHAVKNLSTGRPRRGSIG